MVDEDSQPIDSQAKSLVVGPPTPSSKKSSSPTSSIHDVEKFAKESLEYLNRESAKKHAAKGKGKGKGGKQNPNDIPVYMHEPVTRAGVEALLSKCKRSNPQECESQESSPGYFEDDTTLSLGTPSPAPELPTEKPEIGDGGSKGGDEPEPAPESPSIAPLTVDLLEDASGDSDSYESGSEISEDQEALQDVVS